jgi:hypothetical protein
MPKKDFSLLDSLILQMLKENSGMKKTIYTLYRDLCKKYPVIKVSHPIFYRRVHKLLHDNKNIKMEKIGYYTLVWHEEANIIEIK